MSDEYKSVEVVDRVRKLYRSCTSYKDRGFVRLNGQKVAVFATRYERSQGLLDFIYTDDSNSSELGFKLENAVLTEFRVPKAFPAKLAAPATLDAALAILTGLTFMTARLIPGLLLPHVVRDDVLWSSLADDVVESYQEGERTCIALRVANRGEDASYIVDLSTFMIVRYVTRASIAGNVLPEKLRLERGVPPELPIPEQVVAYTPELTT